MLDGLSAPQEYVDRAVRLRQGALAITDHGVMCGAPQFYHACRKAEIEPILGQEFYFWPDAEWRPEKGEKQPERYHIVLLAKGEAGYQALAELSTAAHRQFYYKPLLDRSLLEGLGSTADHLWCLSGCAASSISRAIRAKDRDRAISELLWWREIFPNFHIELQNHGTDFDDPLNKGLLELAAKYDVPYVATNDPHYAHRRDAGNHDSLLAIQTASDINDENRFRFDGSGYHLRSEKEMERAFARYGTKTWQRARDESNFIARECYTRIPMWEKRSWHIPKYPDCEDAYTLLRELTKQGLKDKGLWKKAEYRQRAKEELFAIKAANIADFLMITLDAIRWAQDQGIAVGPGRGSVCGTLVGYLIGLHKIDPIRYDLMFERFLNLARPRMPDIDTDFPPSRREEVVQYVKDKYGEENVVHVAAYQTMKTKFAFQSLARAYGMDHATRVAISKNLSDDDESLDLLPSDVKGSEHFKPMVAQLQRLVGTKRAISAHPAGVIIADPRDDIRRIVPEMWIPSTKRWVGQYDLEAVEEMGLLKEDFLGLRTLDTISVCLDMIASRSGERLDPDSWVPDEEVGDEEVYKMLAEGRTNGVFQMEGGTNTKGCLEVKPRSFEDIVSITSLYRTGPILAGFPKDFRRNRKGTTEQIPYLHPLLRPILERTWGVILYQEQVMEIAAELAGFDMALVDDIKEAIKHKKSKLMVSLRPRFVEGCRNHSKIRPDIAEEIWSKIEGYSGYSYNRSHAVAYSFLTYQTARLKHFYPLEFMAALLATVGDKDKRLEYLNEIVESGYKVLPPCINLSAEHAIPDYEENGIRFGLGDVGGIGPKQGAKVLEGRPEGGYASLDEVEAAAKNKGVMLALAESGCLSIFGINGTPVKQAQRMDWDFQDIMAPIRAYYKGQLVLPDPDVPNYQCVVVGRIVQVSKRNTKQGKPMLTWKIQYSATKSWHVRIWSEAKNEKHDLWAYKKGDVVAIQGVWKNRYNNIEVSSSDDVQEIDASAFV